MSTRSTIAMVVDGGAIDTVYCHYDGYLEWVGATLALYEEQENVAEMELGDMSSLRPTLSECRFYYRDVGDEDNTREATRKVTFASLTECVEDLESDIIRWLYLFADDQWWVRARGGGGFYRLKDALAAVDATKPTMPEYWRCCHTEIDEVMAEYGVRPRLFTGRAPLIGADG